MNRSMVSAAALFASAVIWAGVATTSPVYARSSGFVLAAGAIVTVGVALVGMVAGAARWALRLGIGTAIMFIGLGVRFDLGLWTLVAMAAAGIALIGLVGNAFSPLIRKRPPVDGPPANAVLLSLLLLLGPVLWAFLSASGLSAGAAIGVATSWTALAVYTKALPGALWVVRLVVPMVLILGATSSPLWTALPMVMCALSVLALAWTADVRLAVQPLAAPGSTVPIPAELAPRDILDAAGIDDRGRRPGPEK